MLVFGILVVGVGIGLIYLALPGGKLWRHYLDDISVSFKATEKEQSTPKRFTIEAMQKLPKQIQVHIENGGYLNQPLMSNMYIRFYNTKFRMAEDKEPMAIDFQQVNFVDRPDRHAFLTGRMFGLPIQAKDSTIDGVGSMTGILAKQFQLFQSTGPEMDQGQLITALADAVFMPALFLQDFVSWTVIDEQTVEGRITWQGVSAKGRFTFDEHGDITRFDTEDRYRDDNGKSSKLVPWFVTYERYQKQNGYWLPGHVKVNWVMPNGEYTYFESDKMKVDFSVAKDHIGY